MHCECLLACRPRLAARLHRPSPGHIGAMLGMALLAAGAAHLIVHGGIA